MSDYGDDYEYRRDRESRDRRRSDRSDRYRRDSRLDSRKERDYQARDRSYDRYDDRYSDRMSENSQYDDYNGDDGYRRSPRRDEDSRYGYRGGRDDMNRVDDRASQKWMADTPSHTILLRGLPPSIDELTLRTELQRMNILPKDVRLVKRKDTGQSRGFAFVEFHTVPEAQLWMEHARGHIVLLDKYTIQMYYSSPKAGSQEARMQDWAKTDWTCLKCGTHNFKRREHCFKCNMSREESEKVKEGDGLEQVGHNPCNTLIFRGLDALTTEENILTALMRVTALPTKNVRVMKDILTNTSKGYAFVEMNSLQESQQLLDTIHNLMFPFEIDGKAVVVSYAKNTFTTVMATMQQQQQVQWNQYYGQAGYANQSAVSAGDSQFYQQNASYDYSTYYSQQQAANASQSDNANAAAALAQAAIQQAQAAKHYKQDVKGPEKTTTPLVISSPPVVAAPPVLQQTVESETPKYPVPDVSTYQYDSSSGYYYDASTGFYYEANTQYYYNPQTQEFLYWDGQKQTYLPAPTQGTAPQQGAPTSPQDDTKGGVEKEVKEKEKKQKVQVAKKIAKDMEKWAKSQNAQKEMMKKVMAQVIPTVTAPAVVNVAVRESATADAGFAVLEKKTERNNLQRINDSQQTPKSGAGGLVASYGSDSEEDMADDEPTTVQALEERLTDWSKLACLLCKRQFPAKETLLKHQQMSDLHKNNLNEYVRAKGINLQSGGTPQQQQQYRDRAKERRQKYGAPPPPHIGGRSHAAPAARDEDVPDELPPPIVIAEQPPTPAMDNNNIGNKLMQKMGWAQGQGLGRENQGMSAPIETKPRQNLSGLGADGANRYYVPQPGENYVSAVKKTMYARYKEFD